MLPLMKGQSIQELQRCDVAYRAPQFDTPHDLHVLDSPMSA